MRSPTDAIRVTPHGGFDYQRATRRHHGVDLAGRAGTVVVAPEDLEILAVLRGGKLASAPTVRGVGLKGYEPAAVLARGRSGYVHVLGHLADGALPSVGQVVREGATVGTISRVGHVHWEVRRADRAPWPRARRGADVVDPLALLSGNRTQPSGNRTPSSIPGLAAAARSLVISHVVGELLPLALLLVLLASRRRR